MLHDLLKEIVNQKIIIHKEVEIKYLERIIIGTSLSYYHVGVGAFGKVFSCKWEGEDAVMKLFNGDVDDFWKEITLLRYEYE